MWVVACLEVRYGTATATTGTTSLQHCLVTLDSTSAAVSCRHNGRYVQTKGLMEQDLMDKIIAYLKDHESSGKPFYMYYAPHAIHQ